MAVFVLADAAWIAMAEKQAELGRQIGKVVKSPSGITYHMTAELALREYKEFVKRIVGDGAYVESHDGRTVVVKCGDCSATQVVYARVRRYTCRCTPRKTRFSFQDILIGA